MPSVPLPDSNAHPTSVQRSGLFHATPLPQSANWAPTHRLTEPWRYVVIEGASKEEFENMTIDLCKCVHIPIIVP